MESPRGIEDLPEELLYRILIIADEREGFKDLKKPGYRAQTPVPVLKFTASAISRLSRHWRDLVAGWPRCWIMYKKFCIEEKNLDQISSTLSHSFLTVQSTNCDLDLLIFVRAPWTRLSNGINVLSPYLPQVRDLTIEYSTSAHDEGEHLELLSNLNPARIREVHFIAFRPTANDAKSATRLPFTIPRITFGADGLLGAYSLARITPTIKLIKANDLQIQSGPYSERGEDVAPLLQALVTKKASIIISNRFRLPTTGSGPAYPEVVSNEVLNVRHVRLGCPMDDLAWFPQVLNSPRVTKLMLWIDDAYGANKMSTWSSRISLRGLTILVLRVWGRMFPTLWNFLDAFPLPLLEELVLSLETLVTFPSGPVTHTRRLAGKLRRLTCRGRGLEAFSLILSLVGMPALVEIELVSLRETDTDYPIIIVNSFQSLQRLVLSGIPGSTPSQMGLLGSFPEGSLTVLDISVIVPHSSEVEAWQKAWLDVERVFSNLQALAISSSMLSQLVLRSCSKIVTLKVLYHSRPSEYLEATTIVGARNLQLLQLNLCNTVRDFEDLTRTMFQLKEMASLAQVQGSRLAKIGVELQGSDWSTCLRPSGSNSLQNLEDQVVRFGNVSERVFPGATDDGLDRLWDSW
jgi:hypothetical protein